MTSEKFLAAYKCHLALRETKIKHVETAMMSMTFSDSHTGYGPFEIETV